MGSQSLTGLLNTQLQRRPLAAINQMNIFLSQLELNDKRIEYDERLQILQNTAT